MSVSFVQEISQIVRMANGGDSTFLSKFLSKFNTRLIVTKGPKPANSTERAKLKNSIKERIKEQIQSFYRKGVVDELIEHGELFSAPEVDGILNTDERDAILDMIHNDMNYSDTGTRYLYKLNSNFAPFPVQCINVFKDDLTRRFDTLFMQYYKKKAKQAFESNNATVFIDMITTLQNIYHRATKLSSFTRLEAVSEYNMHQDAAKQSISYTGKRAIKRYKR